MLFSLLVRVSRKIPRNSPRPKSDSKSRHRLRAMQDIGLVPRRFDQSHHERSHFFALYLITAAEPLSTYPR